MNAPRCVAIIGVGKIARDQHIPTINDSDDFELVAIVDPTPPDLPVPAFGSLEALLREGPAVDAVAICTPARVRTAIALEAIRAGLHVLLEKPPAATLSEIALLRSAVRPGQAVLASWHSRHAPMVKTAKEWLADRTIQGGKMIWREDVHHWHPGQHWLWEPGGFGVFDPAINGLSILTEIAADPWRVLSADFRVPPGLAAPVSAQLKLGTGAAAIMADLHFRDSDTPEWTILLETDRGVMELRNGGCSLTLDGTPVLVPAAEAHIEYEGVYRRFADLITAGRTDIDSRPVELVADAFLLARQSVAEPLDP